MGLNSNHQPQQQASLITEPENGHVQRLKNQQYNGRLIWITLSSAIYLPEANRCEKDGRNGSVKIICGSSHRIEIPEINTTDKDENDEILNKEAFKGNF